MSNNKIQRLREKGRWSFIIKYGVLIWGLGSSLLVSIAIPLVTEVEYNFTQLLAISLPTLCAGGIFFGYLMWRIIVAYDPDTNAEQADTDQPATAPESKLEGGEKPKPDAEVRMKGSAKSKIVRWGFLLAAALLIATILWTRIVPIGASPLPFLLASVDEGHRVADRPYRIYYNDAGAAHNGNFWTYFVKDYGVCRFVVAQGYSTTKIRRGDLPIPVRERDGVTQIGFAKGRYDDTLKWIDLP